jgi:hypothetical protein
MIISQTVGHLGRVISPSQGRYLHTRQHKHRINTYTYQTSMPCVGLKPMIPASERAKTVHALDCSATVTGHIIYIVHIKYGEQLRFGRRGAVVWPIFNHSPEIQL